MSLTDVREAIAAAIETTGLKATPYLTDSVNTPQAAVGGPDITYHGSFDGEATYTFVVRVYMVRDLVFAQRYADELSEPTGATSLVYALENDDYLRSLVYSVTVSRRTPVDGTAVAEAVYLTVDFEVAVTF